MDRAELTDEELYTRRFTEPAQVERQAAWEELQTRYQPNLFVYFRRKLCDSVEAQDCVNDLILALMDRDSYKPDLRSFRAYLWKAAVNLAKRSLKSRADRPSPSTAARELIASDPPALEEIIDIETWLAVEACRATLGDDYADFVRLHLHESLTLDDAAAAVGWKITRAGAKYRLRISLDQIRKCLKKKGFSS